MDGRLYSIVFPAYFRAPVPLASLMNFPQASGPWVFGFKHGGPGSFQVK